MGQRGPIRDPESRRGAAEGLSVTAVSNLERPAPPSYLSTPEREVFQELIDEAVRASLAPLAIDAYLYGKIAVMETMLRTEREPTTFLKIMRTLLTCYQAAGMTEVARRRLGIRPKEKKTGTIQAILEARSRT
jgi:hypothetical protein